ncbi:hypothetical protein [Aromatoleum diolicum]|uniref:Uncharacterized protein n=1 Tax=Aromatoleum diolicum TaxID=75796 RepID=A0ABX1QC28_9RHOO|nr:hypothetical protein [Aromatoleum diolicum]NMG74729.1 hypothetical protein [Aromatoleum diolicum]
MGQGCRIKIDLPAKERYGFNYAEIPEAGPFGAGGNGGISVINPPYWPGYWHLQFTCYSKDAELAKDDLIVWGEAAERWIPNPDGWPVPPAMRFTIYEVKTPNASGWAHTTDDTAVAEERAERRLRYCIYHDERAICGGSTVGNLLTITRHPQADRTPYVLEILRSIEFLDDALSEPAKNPPPQ